MGECPATALQLQRFWVRFGTKIVPANCYSESGLPLVHFFFFFLQQAVK